ncbi:MAG: Npt1/Npt2 family nucleotide transporter [Kofleriaceae bacterium]
MTWPHRMRSSMTEGVRELRAQPRLFFALCALAALLMMTYGLARPPAKSMFAEVYGAGTLPTAWLVVAGTAIAAAWVYGWFAARIPISRLFFATTVIVAAMFVGLRLAIDLVPHSVFLMYVVMETYIVVLVESFWSLANLTYNLRTARVAYGLFCASGSIGALSAELLQPMLSRTLGTQNTLWLVGPTLVLCGWMCRRLGRGALAPPRSTSRGGWEVVMRSRYLWLILLIVASSQIVINLTDYTLTFSLEHTYPGESLRDERTAAFGNVYAIINVVALVLQVLTAPLIGALGVMLVLLLIPGIVGAASSIAWVVPRAVTTSAAFIAAKAFDYSLFRAAKEMLYLPLDMRAKTVGKTYVDMGTYRAAKAGASMLVLLLIPYGIGVVTGTAVGLALIWLLMTLKLGPRYRAELSGARTIGERQHADR